MTEQETRDGAPAADQPTATDEENASPEAPIPFKQFLETVHPSVASIVSGLWFVENLPGTYRIQMVGPPTLRLYCEQCDGERTFGCNKKPELKTGAATPTFMTYCCRDCRGYRKTFALRLTPTQQTNGEGVAYKYGEEPTFGIRVPNKVLRLFGEDRDNFIKGRQCENQGLGVGAFAYYRRVVENHKNEIFDEIIKVCEAVGASEELLGELGSAKKEIKFTEAMKRIKIALPKGLLINGHNPLLALHGALSLGLHDESHAKCLEAAHDVRLVLTDLIEKMSLLRQDNSELHGAVHRLIAKQGGA